MRLGIPGLSKPTNLPQRLLFALGTTLLIVGAAVLAYGIVGYLDSDEGIARDPSLTRLSPEDFPPPDGLEDVEGLPVAIPFNRPPSRVEATTPLRILIEALGIDAPVVEMGMTSEGVPYVPLNGGDVAWYNFSAKPGAGSNAVFAGHINWEQAPGVFANIDDLEAGDVVKLVADNGNELTYEVTDNFHVDPDDPESLKVMTGTDKDIVTLITCGGTWVADSSQQFGGEYTTRTVVQAKFVKANVASASSAGGGN
jgi:LPXTG-site transpeptidase (sortase) family protein